MSMLDTLKKNLTPEQLTAVQDALGDDFDYDMVPRSRLNKVIGQRNEARKQLKQLQNNDEDDDDDVGIEEGSQGGKNPRKHQSSGFTQQDIDNAVDVERNKGKEAIEGLKKNYAVIAKLQQAGIVDPELVVSANLIDMSKVTLDDQGVITGGLDDQITSLTESKPYLKGDNGGVKRGTGKDGGTDKFGAVTSKEEFLKLSLTDKIEFKKANPEVFKDFMKS